MARLPPKIPPAEVTGIEVAEPPPWFRPTVSRICVVPGGETNSAIPPRQSAPFAPVKVAPAFACGPYRPPGLFAQYHCSTRPPGHWTALASCQPVPAVPAGEVNCVPAAVETTVATRRVPWLEAAFGRTRVTLPLPFASPLAWFWVKKPW